MLSPSLSACPHGMELLVVSGRQQFMAKPVKFILPIISCVIVLVLCTL